jgi:hypothetical protein
MRYSDYYIWLSETPKHKKYPSPLPAMVSFSNQQFHKKYSLPGVILCSGLLFFLSRENNTRKTKSGKTIKNLLS